VSAPEAGDGGWSWAGLRRLTVVVGVALGVGAAVGYAVGHEKPPGRPSLGVQPLTRAPLTELERKLIAPLHEGGRLADFDVAEIVPIGEDGVMRLRCRRADAVVQLELVLADPGSPPPPATAGPYAVYYALTGASSADGEALAMALAGVLKANAAAVVPQGLGRKNVR
jgi:hypothetical protein